MDFFGSYQDIYVVIKSYPGDLGEDDFMHWHTSPGE